MKQKNKKLKIAAIALAMALPQVAQAQSVCFVDYKAKQAGAGNLQLHYGVMQLQGKACNNSRVLEKRVSARIAVDNWVLLRIVSRFDQSGVRQRRANAGQYFLRY